MPSLLFLESKFKEKGQEPVFKRGWLKNEEDKKTRILLRRQFQ